MVGLEDLRFWGAREGRTEEGTFEQVLKEVREEVM